jgi:ribA/ribD-fused uncharacterized protein
MSSTSTPDWPRELATLERWLRERRGLPHYAEDGPVCFYGGWASSFAAFPFRATPMLHYPPLERLEFPTREHWFAAHKSLDPRDLEAVLAADGPEAAKRLGREVTLRPGWDDGLSFTVMLAGILHQLDEHAYLREELLATGTRLIAEDSRTDDIWGIRDRDGGFTGLNLLGRAWMAARAQLRAEAF